MNEEPKSIWKKPVRFPQSVLGRLGVMGAVILVIVITSLIVNPLSTKPYAEQGWLIFAAVSIAIVLEGWLCIRWYGSVRNLKRALFALACLATLIALFYAEEDWRGWHAWSQFKHEWEAKGEHFDFASVVPAPVPEDQNFALTPIAYTSYGYILTREGKKIPSEERDTNFVQRLRMETTFGNDANTNQSGDRNKGIFADLAGWQSYYRNLATRTNLYPIPARPQSPAADVLLALSIYDRVLAELRAAAQLPGSRFPLNYDEENPAAILLPHLVCLKLPSLVLRLRSLAELQNGQPDQALADVTLALQLTDKIRNEPFLISHLVRIAMLQIILQPIWEGMAEHRWSEAQLAALAAELARQDYLRDYQLAMRGELAFQGGIVTYLRRDPEHFFTFYDAADYNNQLNASWLGKRLVHLIPTGWYYQNQRRCAQMMVDYYIPVADTNRGVFNPAAVRQAGEVVAATIRRVTPYNALERMMLPDLGNCVPKFAYAQASVDLARTAIALERYRLAQGEYPETLAALAPQFIAQVPHDVIGGGPLKYRREANGLFTLYSVGWNETDDGGVVVFTKDKSPQVDNRQGDWVWRYPAK